MLLLIMKTPQDKARTIQKLEEILDSLCRHVNRNITIIYPEDGQEVIPYLKKEIIKTLDQVE